MLTSALHVLIVAHPDDESMFFVPTLRALKASDETFWILCLTTGDYDGLGNIRSLEMLQTGQLLGADKTLVCDTLKDHPTKRWNVSEVQQQIQHALRNAMGPNDSWSRLVLLTFDRYGVSGHVNHIDTYHGTCALLRQGELILPKQQSSENTVAIPVEGWTLTSERNIISKYIPLVSWILFMWSFFFRVGTVQMNPNYRIYRSIEPSWSWKAMSTHHSQFVWYRRLFVVFSCYTYVNRLERIQNKSMKDK